MSFWVFRCCNCGSWQVKETRIKVSEASFKCFSCGKSTKLKLKRSKVPGLNLSHYGPFDHPKQATVICQEIKKHEATDNGRLFVAELSEFK